MFWVLKQKDLSFFYGMNIEQLQTAVSYVYYSLLFRTNSHAVYNWNALLQYSVGLHLVIEIDFLNVFKLFKQWDTRY